MSPVPLMSTLRFTVLNIVWLILKHFSKASDAARPSAKCNVFHDHRYFQAKQLTVTQLKNICTLANTVWTFNFARPYIRSFYEFQQVFSTKNYRQEP